MTHPQRTWPVVHTWLLALAILAILAPMVACDGEEQQVEIAGMTITDTYSGETSPESPYLRIYKTPQGEWGFEPLEIHLHRGELFTVHNDSDETRRISWVKQIDPETDTTMPNTSLLLFSHRVWIRIPPGKYLQLKVSLTSPDETYQFDIEGIPTGGGPTGKPEGPPN